MNLDYFIYLKFINPGTLLTLKIVFLIISLLLLAGIVFLLKKSSWLETRYALDIKDFMEAKTSRDVKYDRMWAKILKRLNKRSESEWKIAIIEADSFLGQILEKMGYQGETLGERLQKVDATILPSLSIVWQAHKLRNNIVHDPDFKISRNEVETNIRFYEKALRDLNVLG